MKTLMRNGRDRRSENPSLGHAKKERVSLFGTDQRITSGPVARRPHSKAEYMTAPERFADSQIPLAPRAPSIHDPGCVKTLEAFVGAQQKNRTCGLSESFMRGQHPVRIYLLPERPAKRFSRSQDPELPSAGRFCCRAQRRF